MLADESELNVVSVVVSITSCSTFSSSLGVESGGGAVRGSGGGGGEPAGSEKSDTEFHRQ